MNSLDILYYSLSLAALVIAGSLVYLSYHLVETLKEIDLVLEDVKDTTQDIQTMKNTAKAVFFGATNKLLGKLTSKGVRKI